VTRISRSDLTLTREQQQLFDKHQQLVSAAVNRFHRRTTRYGQGDTEDLAQELGAALTRAAQTYKPARASFRTYASRCLDNAARDYIRKLKQPPRMPFAPSYDSVVGHEVEGEGFHQEVKPVTYFDLIERGQAAGDECIGIFDDEGGLIRAMQKGELNALLDKITLSPLERSSFLLAREYDLGPQEIAHIFGVRIAVVSHALDRVIQKIRAAKGKTA
jgi:RNA polymerase sigma factor (sigma-70 family)